MVAMLPCIQHKLLQKPVTKKKELVFISSENNLGKMSFGVL